MLSPRRKCLLLLGNVVVEFACLLVGADAFHHGHHQACSQIRRVVPSGGPQLHGGVNSLEIQSFTATRSAHKTRLHQFFRQREEEASRKLRQKVASKIPESVLQELSSDDFSVPFVFDLKDEDEDEDKDCSVPLEYGVRSNGDIMAKTFKSTVTIRLMKYEDLSTVVRLCVAEFGSGSVTLEDLFLHFPWQDLRKARGKIVDWWDQFALPIFIYLTFLIKISERIPEDHVLLVASLCKDQGKSSGLSSNKMGEELIGLVELSKQPPERTRNPPAIPLPLWYKQFYCRYKKLPKPDGWITNLLVAPKYRGQGYGKLLMAAAEGMANLWRCTAIYLHCDANAVSGKVPQALYQSLGFETIEDNNSPYSWMGNNFANKVVVVEGMPLFFMRKKVS